MSQQWFHGKPRLSNTAPLLCNNHVLITLGSHAHCRTCLEWLRPLFFFFFSRERDQKMRMPGIMGLGRSPGWFRFIRKTWQLNTGDHVLLVSTLLLLHCHKLGTRGLAILVRILVVTVMSLRDKLGSKLIQGPGIPVIFTLVSSY